MRATRAAHGDACWCKAAASAGSVARRSAPPLPRPLVLDADSIAPAVGAVAGAGVERDLAYARGMIQDEVLALLTADAAKYPVRLRSPAAAPGRSRN